MRNYLVFSKQHVVAREALVVGCMSKRVASKENTQESFLLKEYVRISRYEEIQCCRVKTNTYILEILKLYEKK